MLTYLLFGICFPMIMGACFAAGIRLLMPSFDHLDKHIARYFFGLGIIFFGLLGVVVYSFLVHGSVAGDLIKSAGILCIFFAVGFIGRCCWEFLSNLADEQVGPSGEEPWFAR